MPLKITQRGTALSFPVKVVPGSSRDRIVGVLGDALKVAVKKPPQDGAANRAVIGLIADRLGIAAGRVRIVRGHGNAHKELTVDAITADELLSRLAVE